MNDSPHPRPAPEGALTAAAVSAITAVGLVTSMLLSWPTWSLSRELAPVPFFDALPKLGPALSAALAIAVMLLAAATPFAVFARSRLVAAAPPLLATAIGACLMLHDALRAQPWFFLYLLVLWLVGSAAATRAGPIALRRGLLLVLAAVYVYSGAHKFSATFVTDTFPALVDPIASALHLPRWLVTAGAWSVPPGEVAIGILLLIPRLRRAGLFGAAAMHAGILLCLGPLGRDENAVVWPWNLAMVGMLAVVAWPRTQSDPPPHSRVRAPRGFAIATAPALLLACVMPALGLLGAWPLYLSWALYAGREPQLSIGLTESAFAALPESVQRWRRPIDAAPLVHAVVLADWISEQSQARPFPEMWYSRAVAHQLLAALAKARAGQGLEGVLVVEHGVPDRITGTRLERATPAAEYLERGAGR